MRFACQLTDTSTCSLLASSRKYDLFDSWFHSLHTGTGKQLGGRSYSLRGYDHYLFAHTGPSPMQRLCLNVLYLLHDENPAPHRQLGDMGVRVQTTAPTNASHRPLQRQQGSQSSPSQSPSNTRVVVDTYTGHRIPIPLQHHHHQQPPREFLREPHPPVEAAGSLDSTGCILARSTVASVPSLGH